MPARGGLVDGACVALSLAAALAVYWIAEGRIAGAASLSSFPLDDSWIHLHFARNLAEGAGFAYNPGVPVAGSTAPLWTLLLAGTFSLAGIAPAWAKALGITAALATALLTRRLVWTWTESRALALAGGVIAAVAGPLVWGALSGMEVSLAALLVTGAVVLHAAGYDAPTAILLGLAVLTRPESLLLVPLVWLGRPITPGRTAIFAGIVGGVPRAMDSVQPRHGGLSAAGDRGGEGRGRADRGPLGEPGLARRRPRAASLAVRDGVDCDGSSRSMPCFPCSCFPGSGGSGGCVDARRGSPRSCSSCIRSGWRCSRPIAGPDSRRGDTPSICCRSPSRWRWPASRRSVRRGSCRPALAGGLLAAALWTLPAAATRYGWAVQNIDAMQVQLGRWIAANTPPGSRVALNDVGAIAYVSRREVVDVMGLVTPAVIAYRGQGEPGILSYLERACPDYLVIFPAWFPMLSAMTDRFRPIHRITLAHNTVAGADEMVVYKTPWTSAGCR